MDKLSWMYNPYQGSVILPSNILVINSSFPKKHFQPNLNQNQAFPLAGREKLKQEISSCNMESGQTSSDIGGLGIRYPEYMNLELGAKILWRLVSKKFLGGNKCSGKNTSGDQD
jgi:hypothetical protein